MRWLMLCREPRLYSCQRLKEACEEQGIQLDILDPNRMLLSLNVEQGKSVFQLFYQEGERYDKNRKPAYLLPEYDAVLPRFGSSSTEMGCRVLQHFESRQIKVLNRSEAFRLARDKWQSLQKLLANNIPVPMSSFAGSEVSNTELLALHQYPLVVKTLSGSQGVGVMLIENQRSGQGVLDTLKQANLPVLTQHFIAEVKGQDIRAFVIGNQVVATMQRQSSEGEFRANLHQGGSAEKIVLSEAEKQISLNAANAIGLDIAGVDLLRSHHGTMVLEVNASPGLEGIEKTTGLNIAKMMVDYLLKMR